MTATQSPLVGRPPEPAAAQPAGKCAGGWLFAHCRSKRLVTAQCFGCQNQELTPQQRSTRSAIGDGHLALRISQVMVAPDASPSSCQERRAPLLTAAHQVFRGAPGCGLAGARTCRSNPAGAESVELNAGHQLPWVPSPCHVSASTDMSVVDDVRRWREATGTRASVSAVFFAATLREFHRQRIPVANRVLTLFNCRRYLREILPIPDVPPVVRRADRQRGGHSGHTATPPLCPRV